MPNGNPPVNSDIFVIQRADGKNYRFTASEFAAFIGGGGGVITSINGDDTTTQFIAGASGILVVDTPGGIHTISLGNITAPLDMNGFTINNLILPVAGSDAANKTYVDNVVNGLAWKDSARVTTTANITLSGNQTIDGILTVENDRVLVKNQTNAEENGLYNSKALAWTRTDDADTEDDLLNMSVFTELGTVNEGTGWVLTTPPPIIVDTTPLVYAQVSIGGSPNTTKGDLFGFDTGNARIPIGTPNQILSVDLAEATGVKWIDQQALTPWTENIQASDFALLNLGFIESGTVNPAQSEFIRMANNVDKIAWRNQANTSDVELYVDTANKLLVNAGIRGTWYEAGGIVPSLSIVATLRMGFDKKIAWRNQDNTNDYHIDISPGSGTRLRYGANGSPRNIVVTDSVDILTNKSYDADGTGNVITNIGSSEIKSEIITGFATVTPASGDFVLISDTGDSGNLKKVDIATLLDGQTWTASHDAGQFDLTNVGSVDFFILNSPQPPNTHQYIHATSGALKYNVPSLDRHEFYINGIQAFAVQADLGISTLSHNIGLGFGLITKNSSSLGMLLKHNSTGYDNFNHGTALQVLRTNAAGTDLEWATDTVGVQTPIAQDIAYAGFDIKSLSNLEFQTTTGAPIGTVRALYATAAGLFYNVDTGDQHHFEIGGISRMTLSATVMDMKDTNLDVGAGDILFQNPGQTIATDTDGIIFSVPTADDFTFKINSVIEYEFNALNLDMKGNNLDNFAFLDINTGGALRWNGSNSNQIIHDATGMKFEVVLSDTFRYEIDNTEEYNFSATVADFKANSISDVGNVIFNPTGTALAAGIHGIWGTTGGMNYNAPTGDAHTFFINGFVRYAFSNLDVDWKGNSLRNVGLAGIGGDVTTQILQVTIPDDAAAIGKGITIANSDGQMTFKSSTNIVGGFEPTIVAIANGDALRYALWCQIRGVDGAGNTPMYRIDIDKEDGGTVALRPLMQIQNNGSTQWEMLAGGSVDMKGNTLTVGAINSSSITLTDANNIIVGTTTGTKFGTTTSQKIGFWNVTPIVQPTHIADATDAASVITQLNALLAQMAALGLQAAV